MSISRLKKYCSSIEGVPVRVAVVEVNYISINSLEHALYGYDTPTAINATNFRALTTALEAQGELEYTILAVGLFLDYVVSSPFVVDQANRMAHPFSTTSVARIGKAVAGALRNADATKNRVLYVHDMHWQGSYNPPAEAWTELNVDAEAELADMVHQIGEKRIEMSLILGLLKAAVFSGKYPSEYKTVDNELLGLGIMGEEELEAMFGGKCN
ncbi:NmrA-like family protein [Aspergillus fumigatus]